MAQLPEFATYIGFPGYDDRWTDDSPGGIEARRRLLAEGLAQLRTISPDGLGERERLNYSLYRNLYETTEAGLKFGIDAVPFQSGWPRNLRIPLHQMDGVHLTAGHLLGLQRHTTAREYDAIVGRLRSLPEFVSQELVLLEKGLAEGVTPPQIAVRGVPDQVAGLVPEDPLASPLLEAFTEFPAGVSDSDRTRLLSDARRAYIEGVRPAFLGLHAFLVERYLPKCRATIAAGDLPDGAEYYRYLVRWVTTLDLTPAQVHEIGLAEVRRIRAEMDRIIQDTGFHGTFAEFNEFLRTDPRFYYTSAEELVNGFRVIAKRVDPELATHFGTLPRTPYGVLPVPDYAAPSSPGAYYIGGSPVAGRAGFFFANTHDLKSRPKYGMEALTLHEAVPGHHLQLAIASELENVPEFRKHSGTTAFVEGWGLYAESLGEEVGLYRDPYAKYGSLAFDVWRSSRLVVDTGMHALGWSRDRAIQFIRDNTGMSDLDITVEVDRYIVIPGQALAYKIGQRKIRELRRHAETVLGDRFDERAFHDRVLEEGGLPLGELERRIRAWVDAEKARLAR